MRFPLLVCVSGAGFVVADANTLSMSTGPWSAEPPEREWRPGAGSQLGSTSGSAFWFRGKASAGRAPDHSNVLLLGLGPSRETTVYVCKFMCMGDCAGALSQLLSLPLVTP